MGLKVVWRAGWAHATGTVKGIGRVRESLGTRDPGEADEIKAALEARLHRERLYGREAVVTFEEAVEKYALHMRERGKPVRFLAPLVVRFKGLVLRTITQGDLKDAARELLPHAKLATRRRQVITPAAAVINFAAKEYGWCQPIKIDYPTGPTPERVAVGYEWVDRVRAASNPHLAALTLFLFQTGFRISEAVALAPSDVNLKAGTVRAGTTKNGEPRVMALTPEMIEELRALPMREGRVFGYTSTAGVRQGLRRACKRAEVSYLGTHQPGRHSFATALDAAGMSPKATAEAGGWKTVRISQGYVHPTDAARRAAEIMARGTKLPQIEVGISEPIDKKGAVREARPKSREETPVGRV